MSQNPSPYALQDPTPPKPPGATRNTVAIVAIISMTLLLMCGGVVGLGIYAVDRFAEQMAEFAEEEWDEQDAELAVEFAIEQDAMIREQVGAIEHVYGRDELTYHADANPEDYYYDVTGSEGAALVVVEFDEDEQNWFERIELVRGSSIASPRTPLRARRVPFDTQWSERVYDVLTADDQAPAMSLNIGAVTWIIYDYEKSLERDNRTELFFEIRGDDGTETVVVEFDATKSTIVRSIHVVDQNGVKQELIYTSDADAEMSDAPDGDNVGGENATN
jgi:hypothetical protein